MKIATFGACVLFWFARGCEGGHGLSFYFQPRKVKLSEYNFTFAPLRYWTGVSPIGRCSSVPNALPPRTLAPTAQVVGVSFYL